MARTLLVLDEVLAMLQVIGVSEKLRDKFREQALGALKHKGRVDAPGGSDSVTVSSGFGHSSRRGFVELTINETLTQMDAAKAREIGLMLLQGSEAAISDEITIKLLEKVGIDDAHRQGTILLDLRELRQGSRDVVRPQ
jgi:hypothetical protein